MYLHTTSVADPGCLSRILIFTHPGSRISDPRSKNRNKREGWKKVCCHTFFCSHKFHKIEHYFILICWRKKFDPIFYKLLKFLPKKLSLSSQKYGFGIRDPRSGIQGSKRHRIPDPDPQHCTQLYNEITRVHTVPWTVPEPVQIQGGKRWCAECKKHREKLFSCSFLKKSWQGVKTQIITTKLQCSVP